jgi:hypothetical protein
MLKLFLEQINSRVKAKVYENQSNLMVNFVLVESAKKIITLNENENDFITSKDSKNEYYLLDTISEEIFAKIEMINQYVERIYVSFYPKSKKYEFLENLVKTTILELTNFENDIETSLNNGKSANELMVVISSSKASKLKNYKRMVLKRKIIHVVKLHLFVICVYLTNIFKIFKIPTYIFVFFFLALITVIFSIAGFTKIWFFLLIIHLFSALLRTLYVLDREVEFPRF